jgi:hypothetical protein
VFLIFLGKYLNRTYASQQKSVSFFKITLINGNIFSIWDRCFGTFMKLDREKLIYGVDVFPNEKENGNILVLLKQPFQKYQKSTTIPSKK